METLIITGVLLAAAFAFAATDWRSAERKVEDFEATGVFHQVRRLGEDLVFLQLTPDPADALREDFDEILDPARRVLAPLLADPSGVVIE